MRTNRFKTVLTLLLLLATPIAAQAWQRGKVERFATLPPGEAHPEGICVDREGNVYVVTVEVKKAETSKGTLLVFDPKGKHLRTVRIADSSPWLLDLGFHPQTGQLLVIDYKTGRTEARYRTQVQLYALALQRATNTPARAILVAL